MKYLNTKVITNSRNLRIIKYCKVYLKITKYSLNCKNILKRFRI